MNSFETERLRLRAATVAEAQALLESRPLPDLEFAGEQPTAPTRDVMPLVLASAHVDPPRFVNYFMLHRPDDLVIGEIGASFSDDRRVATVGYDVAPEFEGQGYTTEALRGLIAHLFAHRVEAVQADTLVDHVASRRVMEKAGMRFVRNFEREEEGEMATFALYEIRRDDGPPRIP